MIGISLLDNPKAWLLALVCMFTAGFCLGVYTHLRYFCWVASYYGVQGDTCKICRFRSSGLRSGKCFECPHYNHTYFRSSLFEDETDWTKVHPTKQRQTRTIQKRLERKKLKAATRKGRDINGIIKEERGPEAVG